ncbi:MAG: hypothetical protein ACREFH_10735, partial [Stellaceae bacterium]
MLLIAVGFAVSWFSQDIGSQTFHIKQPVAKAHWPQQFQLTRGSKTTLAIDQPASTLLRAHLSAGMHEIIIEGKNDKHPQSEYDVIIPPKPIVICIDLCPPKTEAWMADWLPLLLTGKPEQVDVSAEFIAPTAAPKGNPTSLNVPKGNTEYKLDAGRFARIDLPADRGATVSASEKGALGDEPALAVFRRNQKDQWEELTTTSDNTRQISLDPGAAYQICV